MTEQIALWETGNPASPVAAMPTRPRQEPMPAWLVEKLIENGIIDRETRATRRARMSLCPSCRRPVILGMDANPARPHAGAMAQMCDPRPVSPEGEALAIMTGRSTHPYRWVGDHYEIGTVRGLAEIRSPRRRGFDVLVKHDCNLTDQPLPNMPSQLPPPIWLQQSPVSDEPPF